MKFEPNFMCPVTFSILRPPHNIQKFKLKQNSLANFLIYNNLWQRITVTYIISVSYAKCFLLTLPLQFLTPSLMRMGIFHICSYSSTHWFLSLQRPFLHRKFRSNRSNLLHEGWGWGLMILARLWRVYNIY